MGQGEQEGGGRSEEVGQPTELGSSRSCHSEAARGYEVRDAPSPTFSRRSYLSSDMMGGQDKRDGRRASGQAGGWWLFWRVWRGGCESARAAPRLHTLSVDARREDEARRGRGPVECRRVDGVHRAAGAVKGSRGQTSASDASLSLLNDFQTLPRRGGNVSSSSLLRSRFDISPLPPALAQTD